jgi:hypothetical protein
MRCSNCGWEGPYHGRVCPACGANKSRDKMIHLIASLVGLAVCGATVLVGSAFGLEIITGLIVGGILGTVAFLLTRSIVAQPGLWLIGSVVAIVLGLAGWAYYGTHKAEVDRWLQEHVTAPEQPATTGATSTAATPPAGSTRSAP